MQTATADSLVGRRLEGRYRILDRIARGGMSTVYAAVDERLDRLVAVKVMSPALSADPAFSDRFAREARAAARLTHLNAVSVYDQGHEIAADGHHVFLVMELVEGRTLRELLHERGRLGPAEAVSLMEPVLSALAAAHRAGLVHRDIKPENILLSDEGVVKVADFGLARAVETDPTATRTGLMMGTVAYCAPEQLSRGNSDPRSDVYSAGVVFFELLTGAPPYRGESAMNIAYQHVHSRVPAPSSRVKGVPSEIDEVVVAVTDSDPTGRPSDAGGFLAELADVRTALALPVTPVPPRARTRRAQRPEAGDRATTALDRERALAKNETVFVPKEGDTGRLPNGRHHTARGFAGPSSRPGRGRPPQDDAAGYPGPSLPPPVVIPPPRRRGADRREIDPRRRGRRRALIAVLVVLLLGAGSFFGAKAVIEWRFAHVPGVGGGTTQSAIAAIQKAGYKARVEPGPVFSERVPKGRVVSTDPGGGTRLATGKTVSLTLSAGPRLYEIPGLAGRTPDEARAALSALGPVTIISGIKIESSDSVAQGRVTRSDPPAGTRVRQAKPITLYVSTGPAIIDVPAIASGTPITNAKRTLKKAHLKSVATEEYSDSVDKGGVISVSPSDKARKFSTVTITVSQGPEFVTVPEIATGSPASDAADALRGVGLEPEFSVFGGTEPASVLAVSPGSGTQVRVGSTVTIYAIAK